MQNELKKLYQEEIMPNLAKELNITNVLALPKMTKVVINVGVGEGATNKKVLEIVSRDIETISGQKPIITIAKKSVAAFKIRKGLPIGVKVTLRGEKMYSFLEKLFRVVLPRIRDFRGLKLSCIDASGNFSIGLTDQTLFPEIEYDKIDKIRGLQVTIVTKNSNKEKSLKMFQALKVPFLTN